LADVLDRYEASFSRLLPLLRSQLTAAFLAASSICMIAAALSLHKEHPLTMEVPRDQYPLAAVQFIKAHHLHGNALMFFDWGELCIWELPQVAVSVDGRMDTCYSHALLEEHWKFYNGQIVNTNILDIDRADLALLPINLAGASALAARPGWQPVYVDALAVVLVHHPARFSQLAHSDLPVQGPPDATLGRAAFPNKPSARLLQPSGMIQKNPGDSESL
jgi:hypothetical protein